VAERKNMTLLTWFGLWWRKQIYQYHFGGDALL